VFVGVDAGISIASFSSKAFESISLPESMVKFDARIKTISAVP